MDIWRKVTIPKIYLAGPFFNPLQQDIVERIETALLEKGYTYYSPWTEQGRTPAKLDTSEQAQAIFYSNLNAMATCDIMLAVLDYKIPDDCNMGVLHSPSPEPFSSGASFKPLQLSDTGTIWEIGYFFAKNKPVIGFTERQPGNKLNLMVTTCMSMVLYGWDMLHVTFKTDGVLIDRVHNWKGRYA